ncbi:MAG: DUF1588 domain-containing protein [Bryobacterales bacterium]|nr:DUF1588 domain-containing protein [Bryobacterales bacterium]
MRRAVFLLATAVIASAADPQAVLRQYCQPCHNHNPQDPQTREAIIAKLRSGAMPPPGRPRPARDLYAATIAQLETAADTEAAAAKPNINQPGPRLRRRNRAEYNNAINDLLGLNVDIRSQLPGDETADGSFDNYAAALTLSTAHLERYLSVARQVTRLAVGLPPTQPRAETFSIPLHVLQSDRQSDLQPYGTRGGLAVSYWFPVTGQYSFKVQLQRQYQDYLKGMGWPQPLDLRIDNTLLQRWTVGGQAKGRPAGASYAGDGEPGFAGSPEWERYMQVEGDAYLEYKVRVEAGPRTVSIAFPRLSYEPEGLFQPLQRGRVIANDQVYMDHANVASLTIAGPDGPTTIAANTPSRQAIFPCYPKTPAEELPCARQILTALATKAYQRHATPQDLETLLSFFNTPSPSFEHRIQFALERLLLDPEFLFLLPTASPASRRATFLQSTLATDTLPNLTHPKTIAALTDNFAAQWLNLRRIPEVVVDPDRYPNYDDTLLQSFDQETRLFFAHNLRHDRPVSELLTANYTFVNERLARHYGIPGVQGSRFRLVHYPNPAQRTGLLSHGSILATTSYPDRTSPVLRGKWLLNNILGLHVPNPPEGVDTTLASKPGRPSSIRQRLAEHRKNPACNSCHTAIDPLGFALEHYDSIGAFRTQDDSALPIDARGETANGDILNGLQGLNRFLLADPESFPRTVTEKLMAYALSRPLTWQDQPTVRAIVRQAAPNNYRWSALIQGILESPQFQGATAP